MHQPPSSRAPKPSAFSLVELSIVLVILGLLVGGILSGQALIRAAELRSVATQYQKFIAATNSFKDKYFALPGDMTNASSFWGAADGSTGNTAGCVAAVGTGTQTCNGNGDGQVLESTASNEHFRFWQHLANAGLIEGTYDGITHGTSSTSATTVNSPSGRISSSLWFVYYWGTAAGNSSQFSGLYNNFFLFGGVLTNTSPANNLLKPEELWNIDTKMDDGMPDNGKIVAWNWGGCTNAASFSDTSATYLLASSVIGCGAIFRQQF
jgi:prepilin-type N-terminal cleavage/methylation domain-containing protein